MNKKTALVVGATGVCGRNLIKELIIDPDWDIIALSRRIPDVEGNYQHIPVDLTDQKDVQQKLRGLLQVTHVFYSAYIEKPNWSEMVSPNMKMLVNLMDVIEPTAKQLAHVNIMEGTKWYGSNLGPFKTPASETDPDPSPPNFYHAQQKYIQKLQLNKEWSWSAARPHSICGFATGNPMNLVMVLAAYATLSKELGIPLNFPGSNASSQALFNVTDSSLLARACIWMSTDSVAANEPFNITNGDIFRWKNIWPAIAKYFGTKVGEAKKIDLVEVMSDKGNVWEKLVKKNDLLPISFAELVPWKYGNLVFGQEFDIISSTTKARQFGFSEIQDSEKMFLRHFDELRLNRIIP